LSIEGPRVRELEAVQALRGSSLGREDLGSTQREPKRDRLLLLAQEACLIAGRERLFEDWSFRQGMDRGAFGRFRGTGAILPPLCHEGGKILRIGVPRIHRRLRSTRRRFIRHF